MGSDKDVPSTTDGLKIGLALSGGGVRAFAFHLGVLKFLAEENLLEKITFISTVSGGSLSIGTVYSLSRFKMPSSVAFNRDTLPAARAMLTSTDIGWLSIRRLMRNPQWSWNKRSLAVADALHCDWGIDRDVCDLPVAPRWVINATTYQSGVNWRFMPQRMGDYILGYTPSPRYPLSRALAASAGFPGFIGAVPLNTSSFEWFKYKGAELSEPVTMPYETLNLWDGGVYDNLGVEAIYKPNRGPRDGINFVLVCDAGRPLGQAKSRWWLSRGNRLIAIATEQSRAMRARNIVNDLSHKQIQGAYLQLGNSARSILVGCGLPFDQVDELSKKGLTEDEVRSAADFETTLRRLNPTEFDCLLWHGYEVAQYTLRGRCSRLFPWP